MVTYQLLSEFSEIIAFTTLRDTVSSEKPVRFTGNPEHKAVENKKRLAEVLGIQASQLVFPRQTHSTNVIRITGLPSEEYKDTDALVTNTPDICLCVQTADCVPLLFYDPINHAVAAVHAGWRGTVGLIGKTAVQKLHELYSSSPKNIRAVIGPSIGPEKYEIGNEVADIVLDTVPNAQKTLSKYPSGKFHLDLWEANRQVLLDCGILPKNIEVVNQCTFTETGRFFSARRDGIETGRLVSGIMLK